MKPEPKVFILFGLTQDMEARDIELLKNLKDQQAKYSAISKLNSFMSR
jgi:hypothetical protein